MKRSSKPEAGAGKDPLDLPPFIRIITCAARWLYRLALLMSAFLLIRIGWTYGISDPMSWPLVSGGLFLVISEFIFVWFNYLEKK